VVNISPESFYSDSFSPSSQTATRVEYLRRSGADIIDIGARSTAYNAPPLSVAEERTRITATLRDLDGCGIPLSLDTCHAEVLDAALRYDIALINDIGGLADPAYTRIAADSGLPVIAMATHKIPGDPTNLQETHAALQEVLTRAQSAGIADRLILDPGIGKWSESRTSDADWDLCRHFSELKRYDCPLLAAVSRKRFIGDALQKPAQDRLSGSLAVLGYLIEAGANILRVHDVAETRDVVSVYKNLLK
ncbi:MAG TPA: dihydropteroate synthase, partial [Methanocorpusculum sp.]|nr:dihydropteroate synthase [Methanocorpusculum sp.]